MRALCVDFCQNSSMHGVKYLVGKERTLMERIMWFLIFLLMTVLLTILVYGMWIGIYMSPVSVVVENPHYDLSLVDFPAVTICPYIKVVRSKVEMLMKSYVKNEENYTAFRNSIIALSLLKFPVFDIAQNYINNKSFYPIPNEDIINIMQKVSPDVDEIMKHCKWRSVYYDCKFLFRQQITQEGFCYSFNSFTSERSQYEFGGKFPLRLQDEKMRIFKTNMFGRGSGLGFHLITLGKQVLDTKVQQDVYFCAVHNPTTYPALSQAVTIVPNRPNKLTEIGVSLAIIEADESIRNINPSSRDCTYTNNTGDRKTCIVDCSYSNIFLYCQCLPYYLKPQNVCNLEQVKCLSSLSSRLRNIQLVERLEFFDWTAPPSINCSCLESCAYSTYTAESVTLSLPGINAVGNWTKVNVIFSNYGVKYSRTARNTIRDFLVNSGSIASLLLGFSAVTCFDLIIYILKFLYRGVFIPLNVFGANQKPIFLKRKQVNIHLAQKNSHLFSKNNTLHVNSLVSVSNKYYEYAFKKQHSSNEAVLFRKDTSSTVLYPYLN